MMKIFNKIEADFYLYISAYLGTPYLEFTKSGINIVRPERHFSKIEEILISRWLKAYEKNINNFQIKDNKIIIY
jgi:hypothetical protein